MTVRAFLNPPVGQALFGVGREAIVVGHRVHERAFRVGRGE